MAIWGTANGEERRGQQNGEESNVGFRSVVKLIANKYYMDSFRYLFYSLFAAHPRFTINLPGSVRRII